MVINGISILNALTWPYSRYSLTGKKRPPTKPPKATINQRPKEASFVLFFLLFFVMFLIFWIPSSKLLVHILPVMTFECLNLVYANNRTFQACKGLLSDDDSGAFWEPCGDEFFNHSLLMLPQNECDHPVAMSVAVKCKKQTTVTRRASICSVASSAEAQPETAVASEQDGRSIAAVQETVLKIRLRFNGINKFAKCDVGRPKLNLCFSIRRCCVNVNESRQPCSVF